MEETLTLLADSFPLAANRLPLRYLLPEVLLPVLILTIITPSRLLMTMRTIRMEVARETRATQEIQEIREIREINVHRLITTRCKEYGFIPIVWLIIMPISTVK